MANTLATVNPTLIASSIAEVLSVKFPMLEKFSVNYTEAIPAGIGYGGQLIVKNLPTPATSLFVPGVGFVTQTQSLSDTTITFNAYRGSKVGLNSIELSTPVVQKFLDRFAERQAFALARDLTTDLFSTVAASNFTYSSSFASSSAAGRSSIIAAGKQLDSQGVTDSDRILVVNHNYYAGLYNDPALFNLFNPTNSDVNADKGGLKHALNFDIAKVDPTLLPSGYYNSTSGSLVGFAAHPSAIAFASILPPNPAELVPQAGANVDIGYAIEPNSGLQIVVARWYDPNTETFYILPKIMYGYTVGVQQALQAWISPSSL